MDSNTKIVIDFDSTFVKLEGLEELAKIALRDNPNKLLIIREIEKITNEGMSGKISFEESLESRLKLFKSNKDDVSELINLLQNNVSDSVERNKSFFNDYATNIYIISGGFDDWILPIVLEFGLKENNVLSNKFIYDQNGNIIGVDKSIPLTKSGGKTQCVKDLHLSGNKIMIGDGFTDYEVKKNGIVDKFILYTENVHRKELDISADHVSSSWDDVINELNLIKT